MRKFLALASAIAVLALLVAAAAKEHGNNGHRNDRYESDYHGGRVKAKRYACPPRLAKKHNGCMEPGQARKIGQRSPWSSSRYVSYSRLPTYYRRRYRDSGQS